MFPSGRLPRHVDPNRSISFDPANPDRIEVKLRDSEAGFEARLKASTASGRVVFTELTVQARDVTSTILKSLKIGDIREGVLEQLRFADWATREVGASTTDQEAAYTTIQQTAASLRGTGRRRGRPALDDDFLRHIAERYLELLDQHGQRVVKKLTEELRKKPGPETLSRETVARWVKRARQDGWLTPSTPGKAGGSPGHKLLVHRQERR